MLSLALSTSQQVGEPSLCRNGLPCIASHVSPWCDVSSRMCDEYSGEQRELVPARFSSHSPHYWRALSRSASGVITKTPPDRIAYTTAARPSLG